MKGNLKEYLIELVIVIIGITVAFSLNNMAEANKEASLEKKFIAEIRDDLVRDSTNLHYSYDFSLKKADRLEGFVRLLIEDESMQHQDKLLQSIEVIGNFNFFFPESFTINSLLQSGDFKVIKSDKLKKEILRLVWMYESIERVQNNFTKALDDNYYPKVLKEFDMLTGKTNNPDFFYDTQYRNWVVYVYNDTGTLNFQYIRSIKQIRKILDMIASIEEAN